MQTIFKKGEEAGSDSNPKKIEEKSAEPKRELVTHRINLPK